MLHIIQEAEDESDSIQSGSSPITENDEVDYGLFRGNIFGSYQSLPQADSEIDREESISSPGPQIPEDFVIMGSSTLSRS